mmetsp:Transcript_16833/g.54798  ORF Transcript_16833/g.54798 Transcript_16833/m.54798 type:complete len:411 (+) Transcript_16833:204-1436(+)
MSFLLNLVLGSTNPEELVVSTCKSASVLCAAGRVRRASTPVVSSKVVVGAESTPASKVKCFFSDSEVAAARELVGRQLGEMKVILMGDQEKDVDEDRARKLAKAAVSHNLAWSLASCVTELELESCKNAAHVLANLIGRRDVVSKAFADHVVAKDGAVLEALAGAYPENVAVALACGTILKEAARHEVVAAAILRSPSVWLFLTDYVHLKNFDVAADAFDVVRTLLTKHKSLAATFIEDNYDLFFECFHRLLTSDNYVTCRESLRLLSDILLDRANYATMISYVASRDNLKIFMLLLRSKKQRIQLEAFHVFKVFVANPKKHPAVAKVLYQNKDKLLAFLADFHGGDTDNDQFLEERHLILDTLANLQPPPAEDDPEWTALVDAALGGPGGPTTRLKRKQGTNHRTTTNT